MRLKIIMQKYFTFQPFITTERDENISLGIQLVKKFLEKKHLKHGKIYV